MTVIPAHDVQDRSSKIERLLDAADCQAATTSLRYIHNEIFGTRAQMSRRLQAPLKANIQKGSKRDTQQA